MQNWKLTKIKRIKKESDIKEIRVIFQHFQSSFCHMICAHNFIAFIQKKPRWKYAYCPPRSQYSVKNLPISVVIVLDDTWDKKGIQIPVCVSEIVASSEMFFTH